MDDYEQIIFTGCIRGVTHMKNLLFYVCILE